MFKNFYAMLVVIFTVCTFTARSYANGTTKSTKTKAGEFKAKALESMAGCKADAEKFCSEADGATKMKKCLKDHMSQLTASCKAQVMGGSSLLK